MIQEVIKPSSEVLMHYTLRLEDDSVADSSLDYDKPAQFKMGEGYVSDEFERQLLGMKVGEKKRIYLNAEDAFGEVKEELIYSVPRTKFTALQETELEEGVIVAFTMPNGEEQPGVIRQVSDTLVVVDFNHPLAGRHVMFDIEIISVL